MIKKELGLGIFVLIGILLTLSFVSAYTRSITGFTQYPFSAQTTGQPGVALFDRSLCEAGQDFILQVAPFGCTPSVVRSDLLEEQNVPVFCQISATQINPLIDIESIRHITFSGQLPPEVSGPIRHHPSRAALGVFGDRLESPILDNIGYAVIVLRRQEKESAMPDFVEGTITAKINYDIHNAFGVGQASYYLPELTDNEWKNRFVQYGFWDGRGYLRAESIDTQGATISIYSDREAYGLGRAGEKRIISSVGLGIGETSREIFMPGFNYCLGGFRLRLNGLEDPDTRAKLRINADVIEVKKGEDFLDSRCKIIKIEKFGIAQKAEITCNEDGGKRSNFELGISPRVELKIGGDVAEYNLGDFLYQDGNKFVYLGYVGTEDGSTSVENLYVRLISRPTKIEGLSDRELASVADLDKNLRESNLKEGLISDIRDVAGGGIALVKRVGKFLLEGKRFDKVSYSDEEKNVFGTDIKLVDFAGAQDIRLTDDAERYYEKAAEDYETILDSFTEEEYQGTDLGENALSEEINLAFDTGQKRTAVGLCDDFKSRYPGSAEPEDCNNAYQLANQESSVRDVSIDGRIHRISFDGVFEPSPDDYGALITIIEPGPESEINQITLTKNRIYYINESTNEFIQLLSLDQDSARVNINIRSEGGVISRAGKYIFSSERKTIREGESLAMEGYIFTLDNVNLKKVAKVSVIADINYAETEAEFKFKIGIEKRGIQLSPEKTREKIASLNSTLEKLGSISDKLGTAVTTFKKACLGVGGFLTVKNFFANLGGKGIARQKVMRGDGGWVEKCRSEVNEGEYRNVDSCLLDNSKAIDSSVDVIAEALDRQNKEIERLQELNKIDDGFLGEDIIDNKGLTDGFIDEVSTELDSNLEGLETIEVNNRNVNVAEILDSINSDTTFFTQVRNLHLNSRLLNSDNEQVREIALAEVKKELGDIWVNSRDEQERKTFAGSFGNAAALFSSEGKSIKIPITGVKTWGDVRGDFETTGVSIDNNNFTFKLKDRSNAREYLLVLDNDYVIQQTYLIGAGNTLTPEGNETNPNTQNIVFEYFDRTAYQNPYENPEVRYYEIEPYKGLPAIVPFDLRNGWYAAVKSNLPVGGAIRAYDDSGRVSSFYVCNVGENHREEFSSGIGDDICRGFVPKASQPPDFHGLSPGESSRLMGEAVSAIVSASRQRAYRVDGQTIKVGAPYADIPDIQCQDFMSPSDCNLLFNVCDPVVCPSSRCDLDGTYPVKDVIQSGIAGSIFLCLPNFPEVKVPICLSGVHAGMESYLSVVDSYQQCLQTSLDTGQTLGICDELNSLYMCDFFWRQTLPLAKAAAPKIIGAVLGQNVRGGGEYLGVRDAFDTAEQSVDFFTQYYAANSYAAFKARTAEGVGGEFCKGFISAVNPQGGNLLDALTAPDVPVQFIGRFEEIPFTTATNPPISQYKVFYHIYAGKDFPAYFEVYLRDPTGSSFYRDTSFRRTVAKGFIAVGEYATQTRDFTAPSGYQQLCIIVNGREECGFKQVTTDFGINYLTEQYVASQARQTDIKSETQCVSGSPSAFSLLNPLQVFGPSAGIQAGVEETLNPAIYNRGIIRVCSTDDPGRGTDALAGEGNSRWRDVGYCDNTKLRCWLDTESVTDVIRSTKLEDQILGDGEDQYLERLRAEGNFLTDEGFEDLVQDVKKEDDNLKKIDTITGKLDMIFRNYQKAYMHLLRGNAYKELAIIAYQEIVKKMGEERVIGDYPRFEFEDGSFLSTNLYYTYLEGDWYWTKFPNGFERNEGIKVDVNLEATGERFTERDREFIQGLVGNSYQGGLRLLIERTVSNAEGWPANPRVSTKSVGFTFEEDKELRLFKVKQEKAIDIFIDGDTYQDVTDIYFRFDFSQRRWEWSYGGIEFPLQEDWRLVSIKPSKVEIYQDGNVREIELILLTDLEGEGFFDGAEIIFGIDAESFSLERLEKVISEEEAGVEGIIGEDIIEDDFSEKEREVIENSGACGDCGDGFINACGLDECIAIGENIGIECVYKDRIWPLPNTCTAPESGEEQGETTTGGCSTIEGCQKLTGKKIIELAKKKIQSSGIDFGTVESDTGAKSFECLVLQVAMQESTLKHCERSYDENNNPLYCEGNIDQLNRPESGENSLGVMQINIEVHDINAEDFETNVNFGIDLLIKNYDANLVKKYNCGLQKNYRGWNRTLRFYNGWNTDCTKGDVEYVENVLGRRNQISSLFFEDCRN